MFFPQTITHKSLEPLHKPLPSRDKPSTSKPTQIISILHLNIRSIRNKLLELESFIYGLESPPKVICLTETHLDDDDDTSNFRLPGYSNIEVKNRNKYGGGVMIQVHESATINKTLQTPFEEAINSQSYTFKTLVVYSKPRTNKNQFIELLDEYLQGNTSATMPFIICGDFNIDTKSQNLISSNYVDIINANGFSLFDSSDRPTRETDHSSTCLDHFIYQNIPSFKSNILFHQNVADHYPILASWLVNDLDQTDAQCKFRNTKFIHVESRRQLFLHELQEHLSLREVEILSSRDPSIAFEIFNSSFIKVFDKFAPMQNEKEIKSNNKPKWLTNSLKNLKTKRNKAHRKWKSNPNNQDYLANFKIQRKNFENAYKKIKKKSYYADKFKSCIGDSRQTYHLLKEISGRSTHSKNIPILSSCYEANQLPSLGDVAEKFNQYFVNVPNNISQSINNVPPIPIPDNDKSLYLYPVSTFEVEELIDSLAHKASSGDDGLSNVIIKLSAPVTVRFMTHY